MAGIRIIESSGKTMLYPALWAGGDEVPVVFIVVKDGATALAHPDYISDILYEIDHGALPMEDAWDALMVKTPTMPYPEVCRMRLLTGTGGGGEVLVGDRIVHRFS